MADSELLPLPETLARSGYKSSVEHYAHACVERNVNALVEGLNAALGKVIEHRNSRMEAHARAERLAEALRMIESAKDRGFGIDYARGVAQGALRAALDQEVGNG